MLPDLVSPLLTAGVWPVSRWSVVIPVLSGHRSEPQHSDHHVLHVITGLRPPGPRDEVRDSLRRVLDRPHPRPPALQGDHSETQCPQGSRCIFRDSFGDNGFIRLILSKFYILFLQSRQFLHLSAIKSHNSRQFRKHAGTIKTIKICKTNTLLNNLHASTCIIKQ